LLLKHRKAPGLNLPEAESSWAWAQQVQVQPAAENSIPAYN